MSSFVDVIRPSSKLLARTFDVVCIIGAALVLGFLSQFKIHLWFTPVPITLQTFGVMMIGALLGSKRGALSIMSYLAMGVLGLPVFGGIASLVGPLGGYFLGFVLSAYLVGLLLERGWRESVIWTMISFILGSLVILVVGAYWLSFFVGSENALALGVYPFLLGDLLKVGVASLALPSGWKALQRFRE